jgi:hypothetical protein
VLLRVFDSFNAVVGGVVIRLGLSAAGIGIGWPLVY